MDNLQILRRGLSEKEVGGVFEGRGYCTLCSLTKNFEDLQYLLQTTKTNFDITAISETTILKNANIVKNINIPNFSYEFTPTKSTAGGTLLYIADHLVHQ